MDNKNTPVNTTVMTMPIKQGSVGLSFGQAPVSRRAMEIVKSAYKIRLPHSWSEIPRLNELAAEEIERIQKKFGEDAFINLRKRTENPLDRGQLLKRLNKAGGGKHIRLTSESRKSPQAQKRAGPWLHWLRSHGQRTVGQDL